MNFMFLNLDPNWAHKIYTKHISNAHSAPTKLTSVISAFSLRLRSYIIVSVIKEFSFPIVPLLQSHCIGEWTQLIECTLVTIAVIMEVFLYDRHTAPVSHFLSTRVRAPGVMPSASRLGPVTRAQTRNARVERKPKRFTGHLIMGWRTQLRFVPLH